MSLKTPVVFIIFNRPETTEKVFAEIAKVKPSKLLVIADGPRESYPSDVKRCQEARNIINEVDWDCEVLTNYSEINLGLRERVFSGLNWVFTQVEEAIILEDDILPHPSFFQFCKELLEKYRDDERIALISGTNLEIIRKNSSYSYYFSRYPQIWGWATWRRFWKSYDVNLKVWAELKKTFWLEEILGNKGVIYHYWRDVFDGVYQGKINSWCYQVVFATWAQNSLAIIPRVNLVSNIGSGIEATNMKRKWHKFSNLKRFKIDFPLFHPSEILRDEVVDKFVEKYSLTPFRPLLTRIFLYLSCRLRRYFTERFYE
ncbi:MAG: glycosyltransferase family 2 protein [Nitrospirota bacterium]